jgi:hypothetical protein
MHGGLLLPNNPWGEIQSLPPPTSQQYLSNQHPKMGKVFLYPWLTLINAWVMNSANSSGGVHPLAIEVKNIVFLHQVPVK